MEEAKRESAQATSEETKSESSPVEHKGGVADKSKDLGSKGLGDEGKPNRNDRRREQSATRR